jgi:hypothetical protein
MTSIYSLRDLTELLRGAQALFFTVGRRRCRSIEPAPMTEEDAQRCEVVMSVARERAELARDLLPYYAANDSPTTLLGGP